MTAIEILPVLDRAFDELFARDCLLFELGTRGISEQTVTFRFGHYLQYLFPEHNVDCEYNRLGSGLKKDEKVDQEWMKPDVIVHWRKVKKQNLCVIEAKKAGNWNAGWGEIEQKLRAFTRVPGNYEYRLGLAWRIAVSQQREKHRAFWFLNGKQICETGLEEFVDDVTHVIDANGGVA
jgi:hypothetical protein